ncbi:MAG: hypothetical protein DHS20C13_21900 [Thermodesulfobacteriota bacterium]|nr:MAG: hypothetical protein DHS20C13_21900 [Thermodesulfobacteriota bacterium]
MKSIFSLVSLFIITSLLFININTTSADTLLGRVTLIGTDGKTDLHNLSSGDKLTYGQKALIRTSGATFMTEKGTELEVQGQRGNLTLQIEKGIIHFRIKPHKALVSFNTKNGDFATPRIVKVSTSIVEGSIMVNETETILELSEGSLQALTDKGVETVKAGDKLLIVSQGTLEESVEQNGETTVEVASSENSNDASEEDDDNSLAGAAIFGGVGAAAITGAIIGASTSGNGGDGRASPIQ